jgi:hypothetical protein
LELRAERKRLEADLASVEEPPETVALHPTALARYRQQVVPESGAFLHHAPVPAFPALAYLQTRKPLSR